MEKVVVFLCSIIIVCFTLSIITHNNEVQSLKEQIFSLEKENLLLKEENSLLKQENDKNAFEKKYSEVVSMLKSYFNLENYHLEKFVKLKDIL